MKRKKRVFMLLAWFTLIGFSAIGLLLIYYFQNQSIYDLFFKPINWAIQIIIGIVVGYISALLALRIIHLPILAETNQFYTNLVKQFNLSKTKIVFISICAGVGEEILFRGAIQEWFGVIITAVIFVAIHGYLNPFDWRISLYGLFMTLVMILIGYMCIYLGLISSIAAHFMIDLVLLLKLNKEETTKIFNGSVVDKLDDVNIIEGQ